MDRIKDFKKDLLLSRLKNIELDLIQNGYKLNKAFLGRYYGIRAHRDRIIIFDVVGQYCERIEYIDPFSVGFSEAVSLYYKIERLYNI